MLLELNYNGLSEFVSACSRNVKNFDSHWKFELERVAGALLRRSVLTQFIETYQGRVDVAWWNKVMNIERGRLGSGSTSYVSGWILKFFNVHTKIEMSDVPEYTISVPVEIHNKLTATKKKVQLIGGFGGVIKSGQAYRPQLSMIVFHDGNEERA